MTDTALYRIKMGQIGKVIRIWTEIDLSAATAIKLRVRKPDETLVELTAGVSPADNTAADYVTTGSDFNAVGMYDADLKVNFGSNVHSYDDTISIEVIDI